MTSCIFFFRFPWSTLDHIFNKIPFSLIQCGLYVAKGSWKHYTTLFWGVGGEQVI